MNAAVNPDCRILVLAPFGKDGALITGVLRQSGYLAEGIQGPGEIVRSMNGNAGAAIISEEVLSDQNIEIIARGAAAQPSWSDFPLIVLVRGGAGAPFSEMAMRACTSMGNVTLLERPIRSATLLSAVQTAVRARMRQYEIRDHLEERKRSEEELRRAHDNLESLVEQRTRALQELSLRLMRVQDSERRRIARELHDGLGQYLTAAKINITILASNPKNSRALADADKALDQAIADIRTLSYLLHPPLLDEVGFDSAAHWYAEGFSKRSGIDVRMNINIPMKRLPEAIELAFFRILQEALTNVHRHSGSQEVEVDLSADSMNLVLEVKDHGHGLPQDMLDHFQKNGMGVGVGLAGIRERLKELGGELIVLSGPSGATLRAVIPLTGHSMVDQTGHLNSSVPA